MGLIVLDSLCNGVEFADTSQNRVLGGLEMGIKNERNTFNLFGSVLGPS